MAYDKFRNTSKDTTRVNDFIRWSPVLVINQDGDNLGTMPTKRALELARQVSLDLVEVNANARPPVCRIMDYGKYKFEQSKKLKKPKELELKEVQLRPSTDEHDVATKVNAIKKFLNAGHRVLLKIKFIKRENVHKELGFELIKQIIELVKEDGTPQSLPTLNEKNIVCTLNPVKKVVR